MKKILILAATLAMVVVAAAPALAQTNAAAQYDEDPGGASGEAVSATGVVEPLGPTTFMYGTHDLTGSGYVMEGEGVDLSAYEGQTVTVSGTLAYEAGEVENGPPMISVSSVEPSEAPADEISGVVLEVRDGSVLVEDASGGQYDFALTANTSFTDGVVYTPEDTPPRAPTAADLAPGLEVSVTPAGAIAESFPAQGEAANVTFLSPWYDGDPDESVEKTLAGTITDVGDGSIVVSEDPTLGIEDPGYCEQAINFSISANTEILTEEGSAATAEDLAEGRPVEVSYTEIPGAPETAICPPQREADSIVILETSNGGDNGSGGNGSGGDDSGGNNSGSGGNGSVADRLGVTVLPDTGGAMLPALGLGAALLAGGLLVRKAIR